jgi:hypothetical protein
MGASYRIIAAALVVAACAAPVRWRHASLPEDQWRRDEATCNRLARQKVDEETAQRDTVAGHRASGHGDAYESAMARVAAAKRVRTLAAQCMTAAGYERLERD